MITRFVIKDAHVPAGIVETMERRIHQRMDAYFKEEAEGDTVISVRITEQKNTYKVEMTMPYMGHTLRTENQEREISLPALDKGIDVLERQMKKLRTRLARDLRKKPPVADAAADADEEEIAAGRVKRYASKPRFWKWTCSVIPSTCSTMSKRAEPRRCIAARMAAAA